MPHDARGRLGEVTLTRRALFQHSSIQPLAAGRLSPSSPRHRYHLKPMSVPRSPAARRRWAVHLRIRHRELSTAMAVTLVMATMSGKFRHRLRAGQPPGAKLKGRDGEQSLVVDLNWSAGLWSAETHPRKRPWCSAAGATMEWTTSKCEPMAEAAGRRPSRGPLLLIVLEPRDMSGFAVTGRPGRTPATVSSSQRRYAGVQQMETRRYGGGARKIGAAGRQIDQCAFRRCIRWCPLPVQES